MNNNRRIGAATVALLVVVLVLGSWLSRRLALFSAEDLLLQTENTYVLEDDLDRSLAVFAQTVELNGDVDGYALIGADDATISGRVADDLTVMAGNVAFGGDVAGNVVVLADNVQLSGTTAGETLVVASNLTLEEGYEGAVIACTENIRENSTGQILPCDHEASRQLFQRAGIQLASVGLLTLVRNARFSAHVLPSTLFLTGIGALLVTIFPRPFQNIEVSVRAHPARMLLTGGLVTLMMIGLTTAYLLLLVYVPFVAVITGPVYLLALLAFWLLLLAGWIALALSLGRLLVQRFSDKSAPPLVMIVIGGGVLAVLAFAVSWLPTGGLVDLLLFFVLGVAGLGATYVTRLGRRVII